MRQQPDCLRRRAEAIRLSKKELARLAGLDEDNVHRVLKGRNDARSSTLAALDEALAAEEARLAAYLSNLADAAQ